MMINPQSEHRAHQAIRLTVVVTMLGVLVWGLMPIRDDAAGITDLLERPPQKPIAESDPKPVVLTADAFDVTLWYTPPIANKPESKSPKQTRVAFELLAISGTNDDSGDNLQSSVIYDPQDDSVHTLKLGESIRGYTVSEIRNDSISLTFNGKNFQLVLDSEDAG